jgi:hypothetical protein
LVLHSWRGRRHRSVRLLPPPSADAATLVPDSRPADAATFVPDSRPAAGATSWCLFSPPAAGAATLVGRGQPDMERVVHANEETALNPGPFDIVFHL